MKPRRIVFLLAAIVALLIAAPTFAGGTKEASQATTSAMPYQGVTLNALMEGHPTTDAIKMLLPEFTKATGIKVNLEVLPFEDMTAKAFLTLSQKSSQYDVYFDDWSAHGIGFASAGNIEPLDASISNAKINKYVDMKDFVDTYANFARFQNQQFGLPVYGESTFLMYRKDLFDQYNLKVPTTMDEMMNAAKTIFEKTNGQTFGVTLRGQQGIHAVYVWLAFLWGFGGHWFDQSGKLDLDTPEAIAATAFYRDLLTKYGPPGFANFGWTENRVAFTQGRAAMTIDATVNGAFNEDPKESAVVGKVGYAPVPQAAGVTLKGGQHSLAVHCLYLNKYGKNKEAAFLFMSWATSKDIQTKGFEVAPNSGATSKGALYSAAFQKKYGAFVDGMLAALGKANPGYLPGVPQANEIINKVGVALSQVLANMATPEDALRQVNDDINTNVLK